MKLDDNEFDIREVEPGVYSILQNGIAQEARIDGDTITIAGIGYAIDRTDLRKYQRNHNSTFGSGRDSVKAPMPGKIVRILVRIDEEVSAGQGIVVVEAMKMQNELKAPHAGIVKALRVQENDAVEAGAVLAVIE
jgi:biotin carboxyl carrier protein